MVVCVCMFKFVFMSNILGEINPPGQSDNEEDSEDDNVSNLYQEARLPLQVNINFRIFSFFRPFCKLLRVDAIFSPIHLEVISTLTYQHPSLSTYIELPTWKCQCLFIICLISFLNKNKKPFLFFMAWSSKVPILNKTNWVLLLKVQSLPSYPTIYSAASSETGPMAFQAHCISYFAWSHLWSSNNMNPVTVSLSWIHVMCFDRQNNFASTVKYR